MPKTKPADIAAQVMELSETQVLALRLPEGLATSADAFKNFAAELRAILGEEMAGRIRVVVLAPGMEIELLASGDLERLGLRATAKAPWKSPELLFTAGPLRDAARAGWESANGNADSAQICALTAREGLAQEQRTAEKLNIQAGPA